MTSDIKGIQQVVQGVISALEKGNLRACKYDRLTKVLKHEAQSRACVRQTVCPMQYHKAIKQGVVSRDCFGDLRPSFTVDGRGI